MDEITNWVKRHPIWSAAILVTAVAVCLAIEFTTGNLADVLSSLGGVGTMIAAMAVFVGFRYTRRSVDLQAENLQLDAIQRNNEMFYRASSELSSPSEHARIAALYHLEQLTNPDPDLMHTTMSMICAFLRTRSSEIRAEGNWILNTHNTEDIRVAMQMLKNLIRLEESQHEQGLVSHTRGQFRGNLTGCVFVESSFLLFNMSEWDFRSATFVRCSFTDMYLMGCVWDGARFQECVIEDCDFTASSMEGVRFENTWLTYVRPINDTPFQRVDDVGIDFDELVQEIHSDLKARIRGSYKVSMILD